MTRPPSDLIERLRDADRELKRARLDPAAHRRLQALVADGAEREVRARRQSPWLLLLPAGAAAAALVVVWSLWLRQAPPERPRPQPRELAGFQLAGSGVRLEGRDNVRCRAARCDLGVPELEARLQLQRQTVVRRKGRQIELVGGEVTCEVKPRPRRAGAVKIFVSHGVVEVIGTRFTLQQGGQGGAVELHRGRVRFVSDDGRIVAMEPGQRLSWPLAAPVEPPVSTPDAAPAPPPAVRRPPARLNAEGLRALLERVELLRSQQRYARAARLLRRSLPRIADRATRERLSYEAGAIWTHQLKDRRRACAHWQRHLRAFGASRYGQAIAKARKILGCDPAINKK